MTEALPGSRKWKLCQHNGSTIVISPREPSATCPDCPVPYEDLGPSS